MTDKDFMQQVILLFYVQGMNTAVYGALREDVSVGELYPELEQELRRRIELSD